jgi:hypothetical protein
LFSKYLSYEKCTNPLLFTWKVNLGGVIPVCDVKYILSLLPLYERLDDNTKEKLINKEKVNAGDLINDPILIKNKFDTGKISEKMLMSFILEDIPSFLKQLGEGIIKKYSMRLETDLGKKYNERTLRRFRQFYNLFNKQKWSPLATTLSWSHYCELMAIKNINEMKYYIKIAENQNLSKRNLGGVIPVCDVKYILSLLPLYEGGA